MAIAWFACNGYTVSIPLTDSQPYDLVVDDGHRLQKVFVRTTTATEDSGNFRVGLRTTGGNKSQVKVRHFAQGVVDLLFLVCADGSTYKIPSSVVSARSMLVLGEKYREYLVA